MHTTTLVPPAQLPAIAGGGGRVVGIHFGSPDTKTRPLFATPHDNFVATLLAARVLTLALAQDALLEAAEVAIFGTLADGICIFATPDAVRAVQVAQQELSRQPVRLRFQIGLLQPEGWVCLDPGPEVALGELLAIQRAEALLCQARERVEAAQDNHLAVLAFLAKAKSFFTPET